MFLAFHSVILWIVYLYHVFSDEVISHFVSLRNTDYREQAQLKGARPGTQHQEKDVKNVRSESILWTWH